MPSIFTRIVNGEIPCYKVAETADFLAFLDIRPMKRGHTLVIPKTEVDYLFDLDDSTYLGLNIFAKEVALAMQEVIPCNRIGTAVVGLEVPHAHIHLVPINSVSDLDFKQAPVQLSESEMQSIADDIASAVKRRV